MDGETFDLFIEDSCKNSYMPISHNLKTSIIELYNNEKN